MKEHDTAQEVITVGQMKEIGSAMFQSIPTNLGFEVAEDWRKNKKSRETSLQRS